MHLHGFLKDQNLYLLVKYHSQIHGKSANSSVFYDLLNSKLSKTVIRLYFQYINTNAIVFCYKLFTSEIVNFNRAAIYNHFI